MTDLEQWIGQRGLLAVGVLALLATGGFFLKYAVDRGWIPPLVRAALAVAAGAGVAFWGHRLVGRELRRYGGALIGAGGGLAYLGFWALAGPYALIAREAGVLLLAATAVAVAVLAIRHRIEALAWWALVGGLLAPAFLPPGAGHPERVLAYLAAIGGGAVVVARRMGWRGTFDLGLAGALMLPVVLLPSPLGSHLTIGYFAAAGVAALVATHGTAWPEARGGALALPWSFVLLAAGVDSGQPLRWTALVAGAALALTVLWQERRSDALGSAAELGVFVASPLALVALAAFARPAPLGPWGGAVPLGAALCYLAAGWPRRVSHLVGMGFALLGLAVSGQWDGVAVAEGWTALGVVALGADRWLGQRAGREVGAGLVTAAFAHLFTSALAGRPDVEAAFTGGWSLGWYGLMLGAAAGAGLWRTRAPGGPLEQGRALLWALAGAAFLIGGSLELGRFFHGREAQWSAARLAGHVAWSVFWISCAASLARIAPAFQPPTARRLGLGLALGLTLLTGLVVFAVTPAERPTADAAFVGLWDVGWYALCAGAVLAARWWRAHDTDPESALVGPAALWALAGLAVLAGGSTELHRFFAAQAARWTGATLAGDLAISAFWLGYAAALVGAGFRLGQKAVRSAGLGVAALAVGKVALYDLSNLEALYRVGSFFALALITLAVAYVYNRKARASAA